MAPVNEQERIRVQVVQHFKETATLSGDAERAREVQGSQRAFLAA